MAIVFNCPHCGEAHRVKDELAGKLGKCKRADCRQQILIPMKSTVPANGPANTGGPVDAEALAAAAFSEEAPAAAEETAAAKKIAISCSACDHKFEVDNGMQGKNTRCPECGSVFRVPKIIEDKPADWRDANKGRPSMAKTTEPAPTGAWDVQRKGVSSDAIRKTGADEIEEEEDVGERRIRRLKQLLYGGALIGIIAFVIIYFVRRGRESAQEKWMDKAIEEVENKQDGAKRADFHAAIRSYAGEYFVRAAKKREDLEAAMKHFAEARAKLHDLPVGNVDRNGMLIELGLAYTTCGGDANEVSEEKRLPWTKVPAEVRKTFNSIPAGAWELRVRAMRLLARKLAAKEQALLTTDVAQNCCTGAEQPEMIGKIGIELFLAGKKDLAEKVLAKAPNAAAPALTALWLALHPSEARPPASFAHVPPPPAGTSSVSRNARLAYCEGLALQGKIGEARALAERPTPRPEDGFESIEALILVAAVAVETGKSGEAVAIIDAVAKSLKSEFKDAPQSGWLLVRAVEVAAKAGKMDAVQALLDSIKNPAVNSWARLGVLRLKLADQAKQRADETWVEAITDPSTVSVAAALARAEVARHNAAAGDNSYTKLVEGMTKGTIRPFGYAGTALGQQDRTQK
jgi:hypothetical protein